MKKRPPSCRFTALLFLALLPAAFACPRPAAADIPSTDTPGAPGSALPASHLIRPGETLFSISRRYGVTVEALRALNGLAGSRIIAGDRLVIPGHGDPPGRDGQWPCPAETMGDLLETALEFIGTRYQLGGNGKQGIDCSGLVREVYRRHGTLLPRTAREQFHAGSPVREESFLPGDLLFYRGSRTAGPAHVGIYLGGNRLLHASRNARRVVISDIAANRWYERNFLGARRVAPAGDQRGD